MYSHPVDVNAKTVCKDAATSHILREILKKGTVKSGISGHNNYKKNSAKSCTYCYDSTNVYKKKKMKALLNNSAESISNTVTLTTLNK